MKEMPVRRPVQERSIEKKKRIVEAAYNLFNRKKYEKVNIRMIAREASVSVGTIYSYFRDKRDIFMEARKLYRDEMYSSFMKTIEGKLQPWDKIEKIIIVLLETFEDIIRKYEVFHKENLILSLTDEELAADQVLLERENVRMIAGFILNRLGSEKKNEVAEAVITVIHRTLKAMAEYILFFPSDIKRSDLVRETTSLLACYLKSFVE